MTQYFACYGDDAIHGIGTSPEAAIADAAAQGASCTETAPISAEMFADIDENGWDGFSQAFDINENGEAVEVFWRLTAETTDNTVTVVDADGGRWWPSNEAAAQINAATDQKAEAVRICAKQPMRGEWRD